MPAAPVSNWIVLTTIHAPTQAVEQLLGSLGRDWGVVVVGDAKTPPAWNDWPVEFLSLARQAELFGAFASEAPTDHYCRKNFGYLYALQRGATAILEVDDDGFPGPTFATGLSRTVRGRLIGGGGWANLYRRFTERLIWPRGLPLDAVHRHGELLGAEVVGDCPVQQFLVDGDPDVDAIYRQLFPGADFRFDAVAAPVVVAPGTWCPFNSQNTLWFEAAFPLLYLPHCCSFRVTDIWRSLVAQRALWRSGASVAFHTATLRQVRNLHDLNRDFLDEIPGHTMNRAIAECLEHAAAKLTTGSMAEVGRQLWQALISAGFLPESEGRLLARWFDAFQRS